VSDEGTIGCVFIDRSTGRMVRSVVPCHVWKKSVRRFELHWRACVMITSATSTQHHTRYFMKNVQHVSKLCIVLEHKYMYKVNTKTLLDFK